MFRITYLTEYVLADLDSTVVFECRFHANPLTYDGITWRRNGPHGPETFRRDGTDSRITVDWKEEAGGEVNSRLTVKNVTTADIGGFVCGVDNGIGGETVKETFLLVASKFLLHYFLMNVPIKKLMGLTPPPPL